MLTAAHCVTHEGAIRKGNYTFYAGMRGDRRIAEAKITHFWVGTLDTKTNRTSDWALIRLDRRLGDTVGWLSVQRRNKAELLEDSRVLYLAGYGRDYKNGMVPFWQRDCHFRGEVGRNREWIAHDCSASTGTSGASMFVFDAEADEHKIIAITVAEMRGDDKAKSKADVDFDGSTANIAITSSEFFPKLVELLQASTDSADNR